MNSGLTNKKGFFALIGLLFAIAIICFLGYFVINTYLKQPVLEESAQESIKEQGIDASSHLTVLNSVREKVKDIENQQAGYEKSLQDLRQQ